MRRAGGEGGGGRGGGNGSEGSKSRKQQQLLRYRDALHQRDKSLNSKPPQFFPSFWKEKKEKSERGFVEIAKPY